MPIDPLDSTHLIKNFPDSALLDIARNDSAQHEFRLFAVEILHARKSEKIKHPDIQHLVSDLEIELDGIVFEHPSPGPGPMKAGVTTRTLYGSPEQQFTGFDFEQQGTNIEESKDAVVSDVPTTESTPVPTESNQKEPDAAE